MNIHGNRKMLLPVLCLALIFALSACGNGNSTTPPAQTTPTAEKAENPVPAEGEESVGNAVITAAITVKDYGTITVRLDEEAAPLTVANFVKLAEAGFYDGLSFHRIIDGFMIQGGDPDGNGTGGSEERVKGEFKANGWENPISHVKGVISMARSNDPDSARSQFFITVADATFLDGQYAAFGTVTDGMEVAEKIAQDARPVDNNGTIPPAQQPVMETIVITRSGEA